MLDITEYIASNVEGKTFIDIGGLWGTVNERVSVALLNGALKATMADIMPIDHELWTLFYKRCHEFGVTGYNSLAGVDVVKDDFAAQVPTHDIVHCSGILYHLPDPFKMIQNLLRITNEILIVNSIVIPECIANNVGTLNTLAGVSYCIPGLSPDLRSIFSEHFKDYPACIADLTGKRLPYVFENGFPNFGPWWYLMTPTFISGLFAAANVRVIAEGYTWDNWAYGFVVTKK